MATSIRSLGLVSTPARGRRVWMVICCLLSAAPLVAQTTVRVSRLRIEYRTNPLGVDVAKPRFFWILESLSERASAKAKHE